MRGPLVELLEALAGIFAGPGPLPRQALRSALRAGWAGAPLAQALTRLAEAPAEHLGVSYADHFLVNSWEPVLHLEASVPASGRLCDEQLLGSLEALHARIGFRPSPKRCADHLATNLEALAWGLRRLAGGPTPELEAVLVALIRSHLGPQLQALRSLAEERPMAEAYGAALEATEALVLELQEALEAGTPR